MKYNFSINNKAGGSNPDGFIFEGTPSGSNHRDNISDIVYIQKSGVASALPLNGMGVRLVFRIHNNKDATNGWPTGSAGIAYFLTSVTESNEIGEYIISVNYSQSAVDVLNLGRGKLEVPYLTGSSTSNVLYYNTSNGAITYGPAISGSISGSSESASFAETASYAFTASFVRNAQTSSYVTLAQSASFLTTTASWATSASNAITASFIRLAQTASFVTTAQTASFVLLAQSASNAVTASFVRNAQTASTLATPVPKVIQTAASDETTALTTGSAKVTFRLPYAMTLTSIRASLTTAQSSGNKLTVDVNSGSSTTLLSTKLTFDNGEKTTVTAATASVLALTNLADDSEITVDIDQIGDGTATGLKVTLIGY